MTKRTGRRPYIPLSTSLLDDEIGRKHARPMWNRLQRAELGFANVLSERIWEMEQRRPGNFPIFDQKQPLLIFSDYGGSHKEARFESYAYFLTQPAVLPCWETHRTAIRQDYGFTNCRMAYKKLGAGDRARSLRPWLLAADSLQGLLVTILVEKSFGSFFSADDLARLRLEDPEYAAVKASGIERLFRVCHLLSVFVAGLSTAQHEIIWITDEDEIAANDSRLQLLKRTFMKVSRMYLDFGPQQMHCATTAFDNGSLQIEDLVSIPDLAAGALADVQTQLAISGSLPVGHGRVPVPNSIKRKSEELLKWLSFSDRALRRMVFALWPADEGKIHVNKIVFSSEPQTAKR